MFQAKLVNPNGSPKAIVATHDRVASGKEFQYFFHLLGLTALGVVPSGEFDRAGRQTMRALEPLEAVERAEEIMKLAMETARRNDWAVETAEIDAIYDDAERVVGFNPPPASVNLDDDIPF